MNEIKIKPSLPINSKGVYKKHRVYHVFLGEGKPLEFSNKHDADSYAAMVSKNVNQFIRIANVLYADLFSLYRNVFPGMDAGTDKKLSEYCGDLNDLFGKIYKCTNSNTFSNCYSIFKKLQDFAGELEKFLKKRKLYLFLYSLDTILTSLNSNSFAIQIIKSRMKT